MSTRLARTALRRKAVALLDQQLWCWGRDVCRPEGNLLLDLGMCRYRSPVPGNDRTAYTGRVPGDGVVWLWGFGLAYWRPDVGGVFLKRSGFDPLLMPQPLDRPAHSPDELSPWLVRPTTAALRATAAAAVRAAAGWVAGYEHWVGENFGIGYRRAALAARDTPPAVPAREMARAWENLEKKAGRLSAPVARCVGVKATLLAGLRAPLADAPTHPRSRTHRPRSR